MSIGWVALYSLVCLSVRPSAWWHLHLSPLYDVLDHTNHIFSESSSSGDDNDWDEELQKDKYKDKDTQTHTKTETKCFQDPMYAIFIKSREFKNLKCDIGCLLVTKTQFYALVELNIFQGWIFFRGDYFSQVNIFLGRLVFKEEYFQGWFLKGWTFFTYTI